MGRARAAVSALVGLAAGAAYPVVDLLVSCRHPASEACVWAKAYLPLTFALSIPILGTVVGAFVFGWWSWYARRSSSSSWRSGRGS
ncbi:MAG TPA: hypothetical protein VD965_07075 [Burkholderiales bacterium]|nr:hypothetical protein [Burkholderiales bacterium]